MSKNQEPRSFKIYKCIGIKTWEEYEKYDPMQEFKLPFCHNLEVNKPMEIDPPNCVPLELGPPKFILIRSNGTWRVVICKNM